jgi:hypothetical protein
MDRQGRIRVDEEGRPDFPMFVVVGKLSESREGRHVVLPSVVTLESASYVGGLRADVFEKAVATELLGTQVGENRELDFPGLVIGGFAPEVIDRKLPPKVVESTAEIVNGVADHQPPVIPNLGHSLGDKKDVLRLSVELPTRAEDPRRTPSIRCVHNGTAEVIYVAMRTVELRPATS